MQEELERNYPSSEIQILAVNEEGQESANGVAAADTDLPLLQDVDDNNDGQSDVWAQWDVTYRDVRVLDGSLELQHLANLTTDNLADQASYDSLRAGIVDTATSERVAASPWQNRVEPYDVSQDGFVVPNDVLRIINRINADGAGELPTPTEAVQNYYDVTGDNFVTSLDALRVIRHLNRFSVGAAAEPEPPAASNVDAIFAFAAEQGDEEDHEKDDAVDA